jgi:hypothetical protein
MDLSHYLVLTPTVEEDILSAEAEVAAALLARDDAQTAYDQANVQLSNLRTVQAMLQNIQVASDAKIAPLPDPVTLAPIT